MNENSAKKSMLFWSKKIKWFLIKHPFFEKTTEKIYTPKKGLRIRFWFEGNLQIEGGYEELEINYNSTDLLVLAQRGKNKESITRITWDRFVAFELIAENDAPDEIRKLLNISPDQKN